MSQFNIKRFLNVARWDLSVNSKFYTRSAIMMMAFISTPIVLFYLYNMLTKGFLLMGNTSDNVESFAMTIGMIGIAYSVISAGYMFHNLLTKQGRISELTLPATNLERFLWHAVVIMIGVPLVFFCGVVVADFLHFLFRLMITNADIQSLTAAYYWGEGDFSNWHNYSPGFEDFMEDYGYELVTTIFIWGGCYTRSFSLFNAWKYKYNIPITFLFYFILWTVLPLILLFIGTMFFSKENVLDFIDWIKDTNPHNIVIGVGIVGILVYIGIWLLTYRLYSRAQLTTKRNP
ncbi:MAG: hypothetical protein J6W03_09465 [Bacteroidaceae bacterium]|nr:hypothetical protein [Bacteroidaceae bacterium]